MQRFDQEIWSEKRQRTVKKLADEFRIPISKLEAKLDRNNEKAVRSKEDFYKSFGCYSRSQNPNDTPFCELLLNCKAEEILADIQKFDRLNSKVFAAQKKISASTISEYCLSAFNKRFGRIILENQEVNEFLKEWINHIRRGWNCPC